MERLALILRLLLAVMVIEDVDARVTAAALALRNRMDGTVQGDADTDPPSRIWRDDAVAALGAAS